MFRATLKNLLSLSFLIVLLSACAQTDDQVAVIDAEELLSMQADGVTVVDVRTPEEVKQGKIPGAINIPLSGDFAKSMSDFDKDQSVIVYCRSGRRSTIASEQLKKAGYTAVFNYKGSFNEWTAQKRPIE